MVPQLPGSAAAGEQVPLTVPHIAASARHTPPTQQSVAVVQLWSGQQASPVAPHAAVPMPLEQMVPVPVVSPDAVHTFATQQPPPPHAVAPAPVQHAWPGSPHAAHAPPAAGHVAPVEQVAPPATHSPPPGSQQPPFVHAVAPAQQVSPVPPQVTHLPAALHASPAPVQEFPAQQTSPSAAPQVRQLPPLHASPAPHVSWAQHAWLLPPHAAQLPPVHTASPAVHEFSAQHA